MRIDYNTNIVGIFKRENGEYAWSEGMFQDEYEKALVFFDNRLACGCHKCNKSALYDDMGDYIDKLQDEENLADNELYLVTYHKAFKTYNRIYQEGSDTYKDYPAIGLDGLVDFGITKNDIIKNVKAQKYIEGAAYYKLDKALESNRKIIEQLNSVQNFDWAM